MKKGKVFFYPIDGAGFLRISWYEEPKNDAKEAIAGSGVGFFSDSGNLLCGSTKGRQANTQIQRFIDRSHRKRRKGRLFSY